MSPASPHGRSAPNPAGSVIGGQIGARFGRRLDPRAPRAAIVVVGIGAIAWLL
jgi:uncharacterized membrane protein YfcA